MPTLWSGHLTQLPVSVLVFEIIEHNGAYIYTQHKSGGLVFANLQDGKSSSSKSCWGIVLAYLQHN